MKGTLHFFVLMTSRGLYWASELLASFLSIPSPVRARYNLEDRWCLPNVKPYKSAVVQYDDGSVVSRSYDRVIRMGPIVVLLKDEREEQPYMNILRSDLEVKGDAAKDMIALYIKEYITG